MVGWYLGDMSHDVDFMWVTCVDQELDQLAIGHQELRDQVNIPVPKDILKSFVEVVEIQFQ